MINVTQLRADTAFKGEDGQPYIVLKYEHTKMGRGTANIKVKAKNLINGSVIEKSFISGARVEEVNLMKRKMQFLYREGDEYLFMDPSSFEQHSINKDVIGEQAKFLSDGISVDVRFWEDTPLDVELPPKMEFEVTETDPGVRGNSATNLYKPATLNNGFVTKVPLFVNAGDRVMVDTRTGAYTERAK